MELPTYETTSTGPWRRPEDGAVTLELIELMEKMAAKTHASFHELFGKHGASKFYEQRSKRTKTFSRVTPAERRLKILMDALGYEEVRVTVEVR